MTHQVILRNANILLLLTFPIQYAQALSCFVCKPSYLGEGTQSQRLGLDIIANISRTFPNKFEDDFGFCEALSFSSQFQLSCPITGYQAACIRMNNSVWQALTCGYTDPSVGIGCQTNNNLTICYCASSLCNGVQGWKGGFVLQIVFLLWVVFNGRGF